jgi:hypothetical protein
MTVLIISYLTLVYPCWLGEFAWESFTYWKSRGRPQKEKEDGRGAFELDQPKKVISVIFPGLWMGRKIPE